MRLYPISQDSVLLTNKMKLNNNKNKKEHKMKALLLTLLVLTIFVMGCQDKNGLVDPIDNNNQQSLSKTNNFSMLDDLGLDMDISKDDGSISFYSQDLSISGKKGGRITLNQTWWEKGISMTATLNIPAGAFKGTKDFTIKFDYTDLISFFNSDTVYF